MLDGFGKDLGGVWDAFGTFWEDFGRSKGTLGALGALLLGSARIFDNFTHSYMFLTSQTKPSHVSHFLA